METVFSQGVLGYRYWVLRAGYLSSVVQAQRWPTALLNGRCVVEDSHLPPETDCQCGIYAYFDEKRLKQSILGSFYTWDHFWGADDYKPFKVVLGIVVGRGKTELYQDGFRSEEMQILALSTMARADLETICKNSQIIIADHSREIDKKSQLSELADRYRVEKIQVQDLGSRGDQLAKKHNLIKGSALDLPGPDPEKPLKQLTATALGVALIGAFMLALRGKDIFLSFLNKPTMNSVIVLVVIILLSASFYLANGLITKRAAKAED